MLPPAGVLDGFPAQYTRRAVEVEEVARSRPRAVLQNEMPVEEHRLHFRQEIVIAVEVAPACLNHSDTRIGEEMNGAGEEIGRRNEVGDENGDQFSSRRIEARLQRSGFISVTVRAVAVFDGESQR